MESLQTPGNVNVNSTNQDYNTAPSFPGNFTPPQKSRRGLIIAIIILLVIIGVVFEAVKHSVTGKHKIVISKTLPKGYSASISGKGQFPAGFPMELVFEVQAKPFRGEDTITGSGENQKIVEYYSSSTPEFVYNLYNSSLLKAGWKSSSSIDGQSSKLLVFSKPNNGVYQVIIMPYLKGAQVKLVYITTK